MDIIQHLSSQLNISLTRVQAAVNLIDEGNTIPFIARYRKEATGAMNDEQLRDLSEKLEYLRNLEDRKQTVLSTIDAAGALTDELKAAIDACTTLVALEDLYRPYKPKRKTRATIAIDKGIEPFANAIILGLVQDMDQEAKKYLSDEHEVTTVDMVKQYASDILAERFSDDAEVRQYVRDTTFKYGSISASKKKNAEDKDGVFQIYYEFLKPIRKIQGYQILALDRGENQNILTVSVIIDEEVILTKMNEMLIRRGCNQVRTFLQDVIRDSYTRLLAPAIERDIRNTLTENAQDGAMDVFKNNLHQLLMVPPLANQIVLGWDPAFRTGCKLAVVDPTGKVLDTTVVYVTAPAKENQIKAGIDTVVKLINKYQVSLISCGNGTASRESEAIIVQIIKQCDHDVKYIITNEAGASVYSASKVATEEFPKFDVGQRSAVSIARRVQDPLAELVKIDPKAIGVGQYQHDMNQKKLGIALDGVVENCVNSVGVDLNTASYALLEHVAGISHTLAKNIVAYRESHGQFSRRDQLLDVNKLGPKAYQQAAGFLRIRNGEEPLDNTGVHPESYAITRALMTALKLNGLDHQQMVKIIESTLKQPSTLNRLTTSLNVGLPTLIDILKEIANPGRDPRDEAPKPILRADVLSIDDLKPGMKLKGTVRNITDFGAFVDIGVHQDGLVHKSKMSTKFVKHPLDVVKVNDVVDVTVIEVDAKRKRIGLSMVEK